jgi:periplasmic protein TonB
MAREGLRGHFSGSVPVSIALHLVALLLCVVIPLTAKIVLPVVSVELPEYVRLAPMPPPPEVAVARPPRASAEPVPNPELAPTSAPSSIKAPSNDATPVGPTIGVDPNGLPPGFGTETSIGVSPPVQILAPPPPKPGPVRVADLPVAPRKTVDVRPLYPEVARIARIEGTVVMEAVLDPTGRVTQLRVIRSVPMLDQAAMDAVRQWRYTPSMYGGHPVSVLMTITIRFTLQ